MRFNVGLILFGLVLLIVGVWLKMSNYEECRARGYTVRYCLTTG